MLAQVVVVFVMGMVGVPSPIVMAVVVLIMGVVGELLHIVMAVVPWPRRWWCSSWASWAWLVHHCMSYCGFITCCNYIHSCNSQSSVRRCILL